MDPIVNIAAQRQLARRILEGIALPDEVERLAELVLALDNWRLSGGFDPYREVQRRV